MATYEVGVFVTDEAHQYGENNFGDGYRAKSRAETFYQGAFDESEHSVSFVPGFHTPNPPSEDIFASVTTSCICNPEFNCTYNNLFDWWRTYCKHGDCHDFTRAADTNVLISMAGSGGLGGGRFAVTSQGDELCDLPSDYQTYGYGSDFEAMWVAMQEAGHSLINSTDSDGDGDTAHDLGYVYENGTFEQPTITPMGVNGSTNDCGASVDKSNTSQSHMFWSECAESRFK